ncbi:MAG: hypothetical protein HY716_16910 [Planctomycetes bacterium]|nr:hypothetical protein [Planctomycetota bacterium]
MNGATSRAAATFLLLASTLFSAGPVKLTRGGPDAYGYRCIDNIDEPGGPSFAELWEDISATGTPLGIGGDHDWRYRVRDANGNITPDAASTLGLIHLTGESEPGWTEFMENDSSPDFRSDQAPPSAPVPASPGGYDVASASVDRGSVEFMWEGSTDDVPADALRYEIQVSPIWDFSEIEAAASEVSALSVRLSLTPSRFEKYWRARATDIGGNVSEWSDSAGFRLAWGDDADHGGGDSCAFGAMSSRGAQGAGALAAVLALMALGLKRKK